MSCSDLYASLQALYLWEDVLLIKCVSFFFRFNYFNFRGIWQNWGYDWDSIPGSEYMLANLQCSHLKKKLDWKNMFVLSFPVKNLSLNKDNLYMLELILLIIRAF